MADGGLVLQGIYKIHSVALPLFPSFPLLDAAAVSLLIPPTWCREVN